MAAAMKTTQSLKGMRYAVARWRCTSAGKQQPRTARGTVALHAKPKVVVFDLDGCPGTGEFMLSRGGAPLEPDGDAMLAQSGEASSPWRGDILRQLRTATTRVPPVAISAHGRARVGGRAPRQI